MKCFAHASLALVLFALVACFGVACSDGSGSDDAGPDSAVIDASKDIANDTTLDAGNDATDGTLVDAPADVTLDAPADVTIDASTNPISIQIQAVRVASSAADAGALSLPIDNAIVTYTKTLVGGDPAGFFVQGEQAGPAIFIAVDPQTLTPVPVPGDQVSFTVTSAQTVNGFHAVTAVTSFTRIAQGISLSSLLQDVSNATDLVSNVDGYESEYITFGATVKSAFAAADTSFVEAQVETTALKGNASLNLRLRTPATVKTALGVDAGCTVTFTGVMVRFGGVAQPSAWVSGDFSSLACAAPKVKSAVATADTAVLVTFDRDLSAASLASGGGQFTFDNGLVASAASLTASNQVTVKTGTQVTNVSYTVTVASTLLDMLAKGIDPNANHASFFSFSTVATLQLNEINPNITSSLDLVELLALTPGNITGITLEQDIAGKTILATMPSLAVAKGDLIVVHLGATAATTETSSQADCTDTSCYGGAWDVTGGSTGITYSGRVLVVRAPNNGAIEDAAAFYTATPPAGFATDVMTIQGLAEWLPANCSGNPCNTVALAETVSVSWTACGTAPSGASVARKANVDTNVAGDWTVGTSSFGLTNP